MSLEKKPFLIKIKEPSPFLPILLAITISYLPMNVNSVITVLLLFNHVSFIIIKSSSCFPIKNSKLAILFNIYLSLISMQEIQGIESLEPFSKNFSDLLTNPYV